MRKDVFVPQEEFDDGLCTQPEGLRSEFVDQDTGNHGVQYAKDDAGHAEHQ